MPTITINGQRCDFEQGRTILQVANENGIEIPQYCYHDGLSIVANCRICLGEVWAPNPRSGGAIEPFMGGKLLPTCQTPAGDGMVVHTDSPKAVRNQKSVMEYLLVNHPLDCPVCDQAGECFLQDYSYRYGRGVSRFQESKVKNPKKDLGPHVYLYADRCIMCTRCVRFTREVSGTGELMVAGRGNTEEIDVFPGVALDNELSANVIDLCPVGALLDKDFLFAQRVWFLRSTPSIDPLTASGDNILIEHNQGRIYRIKPRTNPAINKWWITDEVRYGWKFVHAQARLRSPMHRRFGTLDECDFSRAYHEAILGLSDAVQRGTRLALIVSPMLPCEEAYALAKLARSLDPEALLAVGPVPVEGHDKVLPAGADRDDPGAFVVCAEKAPNARGVRRVLQAVAGEGGGEGVLEFDDLLGRPDQDRIGAVIVTGNYPRAWAGSDLIDALRRIRSPERGGDGGFVVVIETLGSDLLDAANVVLPGATWAEKAGTFENARGMLQAFEAAIPVIEMAKTEGQIASDLLAMVTGRDEGEPGGRRLVVVDEQPGEVPAAATIAVPRGRLFNAGDMRREMAESFPSLRVFGTDVSLPTIEATQTPAMEVVEI